VGIRAVSVVAMIVFSLGITACTSSGGKSPTASGTTVSPTATGLFSGTAHAPGSSTATPTATTSATTSASRTATASPAPSPTPSATTSSAYPTSAPVTGGGGTAGLQDAGLLTLGIASLLAGTGALAWRRRLTRRRS
jgi:hypothetical protein